MKKIVACSIFQREMEAVAPETVSQILWLPVGLHVDLDRLKEAIEGGTEGVDHVVCFYGGACHPSMDQLVAAHGGCRLPKKDCVAAFLPDEQRREFERRKAFVMTPGWLRNWREIFREGSGWDDVDARQNFGLYEVVILLDFGVEPIDDMEILEFFEYVQTPVEIVPTDFDFFRENVARLLNE
jgi:hypothetical protein